MTRAEIAKTMEREIDQLDREARDNGHDPHDWTADSIGTAKRTACRGCGYTMVVRLYSDGSVFKSGLPRPCEPSRRY